MRPLLRCLTLTALMMGVGPVAAIPSGEPAPACPSLQPLAGKAAPLGGPWSGQVSYVDFWASWCGPCRESFPFLNQMNKELGGKGLRIVGVNLDENRQDAVNFLQQVPAEFTVAVADNTQCPEQFGVEAMPTSFLIDKKGVVRHVHKGFRAEDRAELRRLVETLLAE